LKKIAYIIILLKSKLIFPSEAIAKGTQKSRKNCNLQQTSVEIALAFFALHRTTVASTTIDVEKGSNSININLLHLLQTTLNS
jgi:hypothetical protein